MSLISVNLHHKNKHLHQSTPMEYVLKTLTKEYSERLQTTIHRYQATEKACMATGITSTERQAFEKAIRRYKEEQTSLTDFLDTIRVGQKYITISSRT